MSVGYAAFNTKLDIKGNADISSEWSIRIISANVLNVNGTAENVKNTYTDLTANLEANLYNEGDYIEYKILVENNGTLDAKLESLGVTNTNNEAVKITSRGLTKGQPLYKKTTAELIVKIEYNDNYTGDKTSTETDITLDFIQNEGGTIVPTKDHLVTYDYVTNGGESTTAENEYVAEGEGINLSYTATKEGYRFLGWSENASSTNPLDILLMGTNDITLYALFEKIDTTPPIISNVSATSTTNSITVVVTATDNESEITKYEYSIDGGVTWKESDKNTYTFNNLIHNKSYDIQIKVTNKENLTSTETKSAITSILDKPTFSEKVSTNKTVTITYPEGCGSTLTCTYVKDSGEEVTVTTKTKDVEFTADGILVSKVSDGTNTVNSSYTVTMPAVIQSWGPSSTTDFHNSIYKPNILTATFLDTNEVPSNAKENWDVSEAKNGSVMAWIIPDEIDSTKYHLYIGGNGGVIANNYSSYIFGGSSLSNNFSSLTTINFGNNFDTSNVTAMNSMFAHCSSLTSLDVSGFDTSNVTNMGYMFNNCSSLSTLNVSEFNTNNVIYMDSMFIDCKTLTSLDLTNFDTGNVANMAWMFAGSSNLASLDLSSFDTSNVTNMSFMFFRCTGLKKLKINNFNTTNVTNMAGIFHSCTDLTNLDVSHFDTSNVTNMSEMFRNCPSLTNLDVSKFNTSNVTDMSFMFYNCSSLSALDVSNFNTSNVTDMSTMFTDCKTLTSLDLINLDTGNVTNMAWMFAGSSNLASLDLSSFDTSNVTNMSFMFFRCTGLKKLKINNFNTTNVTNMAGIFHSCNSLTNIDVSHFDTSNVTNMSEMFRNCTGLTSLDLSNLDTNNVENMDYMFYVASNLTAIYVGTGWTTVNATTTDMFYGCGLSDVTLKEV